MTDSNTNQNLNINTNDRPSRNDKELRMRYYMSIRGKGEFSETFIAPPAHWLNPDLYIINQNFDENASKKNKSIVTILSVWNTMIGSSIVSFPYYARNAGIIPTIRKFYYLII
jgi:hypothetical protein